MCDALAEYMFIESYPVEMTVAESANYRKLQDVFDDTAARNISSDQEVANRIDTFRSEHHSRSSAENGSPPTRAVISSDPTVASISVI